MFTHSNRKRTMLLKLPWFIESTHDCVKCALEENKMWKVIYVLYKSANQVSNTFILRLSHHLLVGRLNLTDFDFYLSFLWSMWEFYVRVSGCKAHRVQVSGKPSVASHGCFIRFEIIFQNWFIDSMLLKWCPLST